MDYVLGSVAALISGDVTPNRPRITKRALTPVKHQPSPNVTPKSEFVTDRSVFLSPSVQKKKALIKKSPKRIFQNTDLDATNESENNLSLSSPKADKVKKHLEQQLEADHKPNMEKAKKIKQRSAVDSSSQQNTGTFVINDVESAESFKNTPKKKKKHKMIEQLSKCNSEYPKFTDSVPNKTESPKKNKLSKSISTEFFDNHVVNKQECLTDSKKSPKNTLKMEKKEKAALFTNSNNYAESNECENIIIQSESKRSKKKQKNQVSVNDESDNLKTEDYSLPSDNSSTKKKKKKKNITIDKESECINNEDKSLTEKKENPGILKKKKKKYFVNPNAITNKDTDSEHESDDDVESETEESNKELLKTEQDEDSSDDEKEVEPPQKKVEKVLETDTKDELARTIFVGNVLFNKKCKKEIKKIFSKHGLIESVRIRTVPVKDGRVTPKLAVIKNELHPERSTVNVYVKFTDASSVERALTENNTILNDHHLRVSRSSSAVDHDPKCSVFVGNLPFALEDEALRAKFEKCGQIDSVRIIRDKKTNAGKGFGYVNFASKDGVELALGLSEEDLTIKNRIIRVQRCAQNKNRQKNQGQPRPQNKPAGNQRGMYQNRGIHKQFPQNKNQFNGNQRGYSESDQGSGAYRRIKRKMQGDNLDGPPNKMRHDVNQPQKEKKQRKEFVGMTSEKKKKQTFSKGQKKKKALSEILTKQ